MDGDCPGDGDRPTITCRSYVCELSQLTNSQPPTTLPAGVHRPSKGWSTTIPNQPEGSVLQDWNLARKHNS